jgi:glutamine synthetase
MKKLEYIWLDGFQPEPSLRSKVKVAEGNPPDWAFDGSSTQQAEGGSSDCIIKPVSEYVGPRSSLLGNV